MVQFFLCCAIPVIFSVLITPGSAFPMKKTATEKIKSERATGSSTLPTSPSLSSLPPSCIGRLSTISNKIGENKNDDYGTTIVNYHVIGTSHFRCNSYEEVSTLIRQKRPDGVVIELDPERLLRLTLDDATTRTTAMMNSSADVVDMIGSRWFGGDFLSAIETSKELNVPIFLGDEYSIETRQRFRKTLFDVDSYNPEKILMTIKRFFRPRLIRKINGHSEILSVGVFGTFLEDPQKLLPLAATLSLAALAVVITIAIDATEATVSSHYETLATLLSLVASFFASCKVYNILIADRDVILASNVERAATTIALLKSNQLIRKRWTFSVNESEYENTPEQISDQPDTTLPTTIPLFTLKNPLEQNAFRNLNLFEPRWLKMIDRLHLTKAQQQVRKVDNALSTSNDSSSEKRIIGCVTCTNKFYSAINVAKTSKDNDASLFIEGRYADVIFRPKGRFGQLTSVSEGSRPSGARKVTAKILGKEAFDLASCRDENGNDRITVVQEGYLTASGLRPIIEGNNTVDVEAVPKNTSDEINIVVVVGLLHANGVLDGLCRTHTEKKNEQSE